MAFFTLAIHPGPVFSFSISIIQSLNNRHPRRSVKNFRGIREGHVAVVGRVMDRKKNETQKESEKGGFRGRELKREREKEEKEEGCWGRCKPSTYKVAIRVKVALCEAWGTSVPITEAHKRRGVGAGWRGLVCGGMQGKRLWSPTQAGPHQTPQAELHGPIWGFQHCFSLAFENTRQELTQWVTHGLKQESDLRGRKKWKPPPSP